MSFEPGQSSEESKRLAMMLRELSTVSLSLNLSLKFEEFTFHVTNV